MAGSDRPPPARDRGSDRPLSPRAARFAAETWRTDRHRRFGRRLEEIRAARRGRGRRRRLAIATGVVLGLVGVVVLGATLGTAGTLAGTVGVVGITVIEMARRRLAERRGAPAWDWKAQRYRVFGRPADRVRGADRRGSEHDGSFVRWLGRHRDAADAGEGPPRG